MTLGGYLIAVRVGNVVSTIITFGLTSVDASETEQITRKAVDKVTADHALSYATLAQDDRRWKRDAQNRPTAGGTQPP